MNEELPAPPKTDPTAVKSKLGEHHATLAIYSAIALFTASGEVLEGDAAKAMLTEKLLWALDSLCYVAGAVLLSIKMVMSGSWQSGKEANPPPKTP